MVEMLHRLSSFRVTSRAPAYSDHLCCTCITHRPAIVTSSLAIVMFFSCHLCSGWILCIHLFCLAHLLFLFVIRFLDKIIVWCFVRKFCEECCLNLYQLCLLSSVCVSHGFLSFVTQFLKWICWKASCICPSACCLFPSFCSSLFLHLFLLSVNIVWWCLLVGACVYIQSCTHFLLTFRTKS